MHSTSASLIADRPAGASTLLISKVTAVPITISVCLYNGRRPLWRAGSALPLPVITHWVRADWRDDTNASEVYVAPDTVSICGLCAERASCLRAGAANLEIHEVVASVPAP